MAGDTNSSDAREQPEAFGSYHLLERIATGGMAEVYRARAYGMAGFEKILVIKRILDHLGRDEEFVRLFIDEARIAVSLLHVNIVQVFDLGEVEGSYYMAMEYVHGLDLARLVSRARELGPFPIALACFIVCEVLKALQFAHERRDDEGRALNIVHCDISPQNVLISFAGEVKITDFGISRAAFQAQKQHEVIRGKYAYMSPEQVEGRRLDGRSDLFSLGIVFYELLTGRRLFKARSRDETLRRVRRAEVPSPRGFRPEIPEDLEDFLLRMLDRRPDERFRDAAQALERLSRLMVEQGFRVTNHELASHVKRVLASQQPAASRPPRPRSLPPSAVVVLAVEAAPPPRSIAAPRSTLSAVSQEWAGIIDEAGGEIWERGRGSMLVVWIARGGLREALSRAVETARALQQVTALAGYRLSSGLAPGVARLVSDTRRPGEGWELAGPFYLARWLMNLSAHRGRILLTEVASRQVPHRSSLLGRIPIHGDRFIKLFELD